MKYYLTEENLIYILRQLKEKNNETFVSKEMHNEDIADLVDVGTIGRTNDLLTDTRNNIVGAINELHTELEDKATEQYVDASASTVQNHVNNMLSGLRLVQMTQSEYDVLAEKDPSTLYIIIG
jgi:hypothetical protein